MEIAPGSILQRMYIRKRVKKNSPSTFCEIGAGNGFISKLLLEEGLSGKAYDLNESACENNKALNKKFIYSGRYSVHNKNFLAEEIIEKYDLIISCMVIEHLDNETVDNYFNKCKAALNKDGRIVIVVPSGMKFWGIEDEIAGHYKRYEYPDFSEISQRHQLEICNLSGLTYPISNWLFGLSNYLVKKNESGKKNLSMQEQTVLSGNRNVKFKTSFPFYMRLILNEITLYPFYLLQTLNSKNKNSMVTYCEFRKHQ